MDQTRGDSKGCQLSCFIIMVPWYGRDGTGYRARFSVRFFVFVFLVGAGAYGTDYEYEHNNTVLMRISGRFYLALFTWLVMQSFAARVIVCTRTRRPGM